MSEPDRIDMERLAQADRLVNAMYGSLVNKVIADIKALPDSCRQSGDDSMLKDVWEEFKYQIQREQSGMFELYEDVIKDICARHVARVDRERQQLLWLWTDGFLDQWVEKDQVSLDDFEAEAIAKKLYERVCDVASNEELAVDPDEERDRERYEEDTRLCDLQSESGEDNPNDVD